MSPTPGDLMSQPLPPPRELVGETSEANAGTVRTVGIYLAALAITALVAILYLIGWDRGMLLALAAGVLGSVVSAYFEKSQDLQPERLPWYLARPLVGGVAGQVLILLIHLGLAGDSVELAWQATVLWGLAGGYAANAVLPSLDQLVADRLGREAETS